jgi:hypothetical protein
MKKNSLYMFNGKMPLHVNSKQIIPNILINTNAKFDRILFKVIYIKGCLKDVKNAWRGDKGY